MFTTTRTSDHVRKLPSAEMDDEKGPAAGADGPLLPAMHHQEVSLDLPTHNDNGPDVVREVKVA